MSGSNSEHSTANRGYPMPTGASLETDLPRLRDALVGVDRDMKQVREEAAAASQTAGGASQTANAAKDDAASARRRADDATKLVAVSENDTAGGLEGKLGVAAGGALTLTKKRPTTITELLELAVREAATNQHGVVRYATEAEARAGAAGDRVISPYVLGKLLGQGNTVPRVRRTSAIRITAADRGTFFEVASGSFVQTFEAVATLGAGWFCYIRNGGTGTVTLDPNGSELVDGVQSYAMYAGECRLLLCDGAALYSCVLEPFSILLTSTGTFNRPPGYTAVEWDGVGGGGGGAGGGAHHYNDPIQVWGGGPGGGGARRQVRVPMASLAASVPVVVGAGGVGGLGRERNTMTRGSDGGDGGDTTFAGHIARGGRGGRGDGTPGGGGAPLLNAPAGSPYAPGPVITAATATSAAVAQFGGGTGGQAGNGSVVAAPGGSAALGGPGGGAGGGHTALSNGNWQQTADLPRPGAAGGSVWKGSEPASGGGGAAGARGATYEAAGQAGGNGITEEGALTGTGGGGGGAGGAGGGRGGNGGRAAGGGGGGATFHIGKGGDGGVGGAGAARLMGVI